MALGEPAAQVRAQQRPADEHDDGSQRIVGLQGVDVVEQRGFERGELARDDARVRCGPIVVGVVLERWELTGHAAGGATMTQWLRARDMPT